jgi:hypothetical protein
LLLRGHRYRKRRSRKPTQKAETAETRVGAAWQQFKSQLPEWMSFQLENWQEEALALNAKERKIRQGLEQMVTEILPVGVGALSWITLQLEIRGWGRFHNRRQVGVVSRNRRKFRHSILSPATQA